ncbi:hypothetical protein [Desulfosoma caldarium]|uniref:hypothetical protein n=1 Tax=Desulfosoma caldarium TaxID=610254 RepID=UPI001B8797CB|nr:hypothetical protein [Desulfosoma caldarium]
MENKNKPTDEPAVEAAKKKPAQQEGDTFRVADLENENRHLQAQVAELQKKAGGDMAESVKKRASDESKQKLILKQKTTIEGAAGAVVVADTLHGYKDRNETGTVSKD